MSGCPSPAATVRLVSHPLGQETIEGVRRLGRGGHGRGGSCGGGWGGGGGTLGKGGQTGGKGPRDGVADGHPAAFSAGDRSFSILNTVPVQTCAGGKDER